MQYDLELDRVVKEIRNQKAKTVCIQLPDGLKQKAKEICDRIKKDTNAEALIWLGSCFGACDVPNLDKLDKDVDLLIQWGHSEWNS